ncbi:MAG: glycosyltransferase [Clostridia bacterium]|nr:glycosyltransferase [Clostridia bacterium]
MKKKMLYMSHVDWNWIKQRPHFLAEGLGEHFDVSVVYAFQNRNRKKLQKRSFEGQDVSPIFSIPFAGRTGITRALNERLLRFQFRRQMKRVKPAYIYLTYPTQESLVPKEFSGTVIYDCMDDHVAMAPEGRKALLREAEARMVKRADIVLVSSENLCNVLLSRYGEEYGAKMNLVRKGYSGEILSMEPKSGKVGEEFVISYIGTVGPWFNFDFVLRSLAEFPNLRYKIIGPVETQIPSAERLDFVGTVEHHKLYDAIQDADCLTMPFVVNDIIVSVDPVKLYEYINYNMNILVVSYPEIARFDPFVFFYDSYESFAAQIKGMMQDNTVKYSNEERVRFLGENGWDSRVSAIVSLLEER